MDFSQALQALKDGRKVTRRRWTDADNRDQWIVRQNGYPEGIPLNRNTAQATGLPEGSVQKFAPYYMLYTIYSTFVPWTPGAGDLNAEDWQVYFLPGEEERLAQEAADAAAAQQIEAANDPDLLVPKLPAEERAREFREALDGLHNHVGKLTKEIDFYRQREENISKYLDVALGPNEEDGAGEGLLGEIALLGTQRDVAIAALAAIAAKQDGIDLREASYFDRLMVMLTPTVGEWRRHFTNEEDTDGWAFTINGRRIDGKDRVTSTEMRIRDLPTLEQEQRMLDIIDGPADPEATQQLIREAGGGERWRPQRLTEIMPLRKSSPDGTQGTAQPLVLAPADGAVVAADPQEVTVPDVPQEEAQDPSASRLRKPRYFMTYPGCDEVEVGLEQFVAAERQAGFRPKGPDVGQAATSGFSSTATNSSGRVEYVPQ